MPSENDFFYFKKFQAKLVSVKLNEIKFRARTLDLNYISLKATKKRILNL